MRNIGAQRRAVSWNEQKYTSKTCVCIWHRLYQQCFCNRDLLVRVKWTNVWVTSHLEKKKIIIMSQPTCIFCVLSTQIRMLQTTFSRSLWKVTITKIGGQLWSVMLMTMLDRDTSHYHDTVRNCSPCFSQGFAKTKCSVICIHPMLITQCP